MGRRSAKCGWRLGLAVAVLVGLIEMMFTLVSCSGVSAGGGGTLPAVNPATHRANVTGTSPGTSTDAAQSVVVTLVVD